MKVDSVEKIDYLLEHGCWAERVECAKHPKLLQDRHLDLLVKDENVWVRREIVEHLDILTPYHVAILADDKDKYIRGYLASNPEYISGQHQKKFMEDIDVYVSYCAKLALGLIKA